LHGRIIEPALKPMDRFCHHPAYENAAKPHDRNFEHCSGRRERSCHNRRNAEPVNNQRNRIVDKTLAFQDGHDPAGNLHPLENRRRCDGVRRRDDRTKEQRGRPREAWNQCLRHPRYGDGRRKNKTKGQQRNRPNIPAEISP
jgi:hypothetical protein